VYIISGFIKTEIRRITTIVSVAVVYWPNCHKHWCNFSLSYAYFYTSNVNRLRIKVTIVVVVVNFCLHLALLRVIDDVMNISRDIK